MYLHRYASVCIKHTWQSLTVLLEEFVSCQNALARVFFFRAAYAVLPLYCYVSIKYSILTVDNLHEVM